MRPKIKANGHAANADDLKMSEIAKLAQISPQRVAQKLRQGKTVSQILKEAETRRTKQMLRQFPAVPVPSDPIVDYNAVAASVSFARAQAEKETWLSKIRRLEYEERSGKLVDRDQVLQQTLHVLLPSLSALRSVARDLRDELTDEQQQLVEHRIEQCLAATDLYLRTWISKAEAGEQFGDGALEVGGGYYIEWRVFRPESKEAN
jgi:hypothetical protein